MSKKYKCGLYVGRFQPIHMGHYYVIDSMLRNCETVIIAVGSAQECYTERNPFSYSIRAHLICKTFGWTQGQVLVVPVLDRENPSNDPSWGDYLVNTVKTYTGLTPDVIYEGEEEERVSWYENLDIPVHTIDKTYVRTSGTDIRRALINDDYDYVTMNCPLSIASNYNRLREEIGKCCNSQET
jgi:bifunctional NMN adenylyltransferase/nudix hydrolase